MVIRPLWKYMQSTMLIEHMVVRLFQVLDDGDWNDSQSLISYYFMRSINLQENTKT